MTVVTVSPGAVTDADANIAEADADTSDTGTTDTPGTGVLGDTVPTDTRHARALAALRSAEVRTGVRRQATAPSRESSHETFREPSRRSSREPIPEPSHGSPREPGSEPSRRSSSEPVPESSDEPSYESSRAQVRALPGGLVNTPAGILAEASSVSPARPAPASGGRVGGPDGGTRVLPVHPRLASLLPDGGLRTGTTVVVRGSTSLLLTLLAEASRDGAWTVLVGYPSAGMAAAADAGCDLARTLVVPLPAGSGVDASAVLAALIDGMDVVVVGPEVALLDQDRRRLAARARERGTVLLAALPTPALSAGYLRLQRPSAGRKASTQQGWGAQVVLEATEGTWAGIDQGAGWLRRRTLRVRRTGRGSAARPLHLDVELPVSRAAGPGVDRAGEERAGENPGVRETAASDGDVRRHGSGNHPRLGLVG